VVLKTVTSRSFGKTSLPSGAGPPFGKSAKTRPNCAIN
jgi:hypothetical protein